MRTYKKTKRFAIDNGLWEDGMSLVKLYSAVKDYEDKISLGYLPTGTVVTTEVIDSLVGNLPVPQAPNKKQEKKMYLDFEAELPDYEDARQSVEERKANFLRSSLWSVYYRKGDELRETFNMNDVPFPVDPKTLVEYIKEGKFEFFKHALNDDGTWRDPKAWNGGFGSYNAMIHFKWINPDKPKDELGFQAARQRIDRAHELTNRVISVGTPAEGLEALTKFEDTDFATA